MTLSAWDDYFIHQTRYNLNRWSNDDPGAFERHYILCHSPDGELYVMIGFAIYPNRGLCDAAVAIRHGVTQRNFFVSRYLTDDRNPASLNIGPLSMHCLEPMKRWRLEMGPNSQAMAFSLEFDASTLPWAHNEERVEKFYSGGFDQALRFTGQVTLDDKVFCADGFYGGRNHTWGDHRPLGKEAAGGTFGLDLVLWGFAHFRDCTFILPVSLTRRAPRTGGDSGSSNWAESGDEASQWEDGVIVYHDGRTVPVNHVRHRLHLEPGTRWSYNRVDLALECSDGTERHLTATPISRECYLRGVGYSGLQGADFGLYHSEGDEYDVSEPRSIGDPLYGANDRVCTFELEGRPGVGFLENILSEDPDWVYQPTL